MLPATGKSQSKLRIAIDPIRLENNQFTENFSQAIHDAGFDVVSPDWKSLRHPNTVVLIQHWPKIFMGAAGRRAALPAILALRLAKILFGHKLVWVAHNATDHDNKNTHDVFSAYLDALDAIIYLSDASQVIIQRLYPQARLKPSFVIPHGVYHPIQSIPHDRTNVVGRVNLLSFGLIRPYKGLENAVKAASMVDKSQVHLRIFGRVYDNLYAEKIRTMSENLPNVECVFEDGNIPPSRIEKEIDDCDGVVLPYRRILNSGSAVHALSRQRPVLVPDVGSMPDLRRVVGSEWVYLFSDSLTASDLERFTESIRSTSTGSPDLCELAWSKISASLNVALKTIIG